MLGTKTRHIRAGTFKTILLVGLLSLSMLALPVINSALGLGDYDIFADDVEDNVTEDASISDEALCEPDPEAEDAPGDSILSIMSIPSISSWGDVQAALDGAVNGDVLDLSGLSSPGLNLTTGPWYTFNVPANLTLTIKGNPAETFKYVAFNFGGNNTITIQDLHIESAQGVVTTLATTTFKHNPAT